MTAIERISVTNASYACIHGVAKYGLIKFIFQSICQVIFMFVSMEFTIGATSPLGATYPTQKGVLPHVWGKTPFCIHFFK